MSSFSYPSEEFPALPEIALDVPDDWGPVVVPGTVLALRAPLVTGTFAVNVVITVTRYLPGFELADAVEGLCRDIGKYPEGRVDEPFDVRIGGENYLVANATFEHPQAGPLLQAHAFTLVEQGTTSDLVHLTGTCGTERVAADYPLLQQVMESVRVKHIVAVG